VSWINTLTGFSQLLYDVDFFDINTGIVSGGNGIILVTTNSGMLWTNRSFTTGLTLSSIQVVNNNFAVIAGFDYFAFPPVGVFYVSTNGGNNWISRSVGLDHVINGISFMNDNTGIATASEGIIYKTTNGGINWTSGRAIRDEITSYDAAYFSSG
jgi:photosystem II stability/assembly factor-like uncharacterized protein